jgi:hypothetical protein
MSLAKLIQESGAYSYDFKKLNDKKLTMKYTEENGFWLLVGEDENGERYILSHTRNKAYYEMMSKRLETKG